MSMPNIPDINPKINIKREDAVSVILSSIGMEELSLAHLMNAEAEKIQFALGTLEGSKKCASDMCTIMEVNRSSAKVLRDIIKNQMLLSMKLEDVLELIPKVAGPGCGGGTPCPPYPPAPCPPECMCPYWPCSTCTQDCIYRECEGASKPYKTEKNENGTTNTYNCKKE